MIHACHMTHPGPTVIFPLSFTNAPSMLAAKATGTWCEKNLIEHHIVVVRLTPADTKDCVMNLAARFEASMKYTPRCRTRQGARSRWQVHSWTLTYTVDMLLRKEVDRGSLCTSRKDSMMSTSVLSEEKGVSFSEQCSATYHFRKALRQAW